MSKKARPHPSAVMSESRNKKNEVVPQAGSNPAKDVGEDPLSHGKASHSLSHLQTTFNTQKGSPLRPGSSSPNSSLIIT